MYPITWICTNKSYLSALIFQLSKSFYVRTVATHPATLGFLPSVIPPRLHPWCYRRFGRSFKFMVLFWLQASKRSSGPLLVSDSWFHYIDPPLAYYLEVVQSFFHLWLYPSCESGFPISNILLPNPWQISWYEFFQKICQEICQEIQ